MSDIYISNKSGNITIKTNKNINNLKNLSFSLSYNPEDIEIIDIKSSM
jgi:aromatic ring-opening dioxygenase catalytic subunit (LigB family)